MLRFRYKQGRGEVKEMIEILTTWMVIATNVAVALVTYKATKRDK
ncbi:hypothetical protein Ahu01nite_098170 [Winogradskya humida]|uniref:Uncharacterized protein n=1 Tax=Winogradskya humida TaxID=113566 RepID=A0ABQ4A775_9ACTN|nr:hypothetical protein Ahu01nite_098170 [Actinoplanes humidus]